MRDELLTSLLKDVSRSFYLTMRILPGAVRPQISLAYLLARTSDTIADTAVLPLENRREALEAFRQRVLGRASARLKFGQLAQNQSSNAERVLLERVEEALALLAEFPVDAQGRIRDVLDIIISGQDLDLVRFDGAKSDHIIALKTDAELDDYTYRVAGCVGEFWTKTCLAGLFDRSRVSEPDLLRDGIRFGKGLQLVNILRDIPADLRNGRCYIPEPSLTQAGLVPIDLLNPASESRFRPAYNALLQRAHDHLTAGWTYTNALPPGQIRVRLACAWPILIGVKTIARLHTGNVLDPACRIKISRPEVRGILLRSLLLYPLRQRWAGLFDFYAKI